MFAYAVVTSVKAGVCNLFLELLAKDAIITFEGQHVKTKGKVQRYRADTGRGGGLSLFLPTVAVNLSSDVQTW